MPTAGVPTTQALIHSGFGTYNYGPRGPREH